MQYFQETTKWDDEKIRNHVYLLNNSKTKMIAFVSAGSTAAFTFKSPIGISTRGRTFRAVPNTFGYNMTSEPEAVEAPAAESWTVAGSKGNTYTVQRDRNRLICSCTGFVFRNKCKHVEQIAAELLVVQ